VTASARTAPSAGCAPGDAAGSSGTPGARGVPTPGLGPAHPRSKGKSPRAAVPQPPLSGSRSPQPVLPWRGPGPPAGLRSAPAAVDSHIPGLSPRRRGASLPAPSPGLAHSQSGPVRPAAATCPAPARPGAAAPTSGRRGGVPSRCITHRVQPGRVFPFSAAPRLGAPHPPGALGWGWGRGRREGVRGGGSGPPRGSRSDVHAAATSPPIRVSLADESPVAPAGRRHGGHGPARAPAGAGMMKSPPGFRHRPRRGMLLKCHVCRASGGIGPSGEVGRAGAALADDGSGACGRMGDAGHGSPVGRPRGTPSTAAPVLPAGLGSPAPPAPRPTCQHPVGHCQPRRWHHRVPSCSEPLPGARLAAQVWREHSSSRALKVTGSACPYLGCAEPAPGLQLAPGCGMRPAWILPRVAAAAVPGAAPGGDGAQLPSAGGVVAGAPAVTAEASLCRERSVPRGVPGCAGPRSVTEPIGGGRCSAGNRPPRPGACA